MGRKVTSDIDISLSRASRFCRIKNVQFRMDAKFFEQ